MSTSQMWPPVGTQASQAPPAPDGIPSDFGGDLHVIGMSVAHARQVLDRQECRAGEPLEECGTLSRFQESTLSPLGAP